MAVTLYGFQYSVYAWIARFALAEKRVAYEWREVNPFAPDVPSEYLTLHPFKRVPVLVSDGFVLYETGSITRYIDEAFPGRRLQPAAPESRARMAQLMSIVDSYAYWPLVCQVFAHGVLGPRIGRPSDPAEVVAGFAAAPRVLAALESLAGPSQWLIDEEISLADIHWAPMIAYFAMHERGALLLDAYPRTAKWFAAIRQRPGFITSHPRLP
ncbi:MAG: glutathione S-transferase family protein [Proteobacteria bacterium]|nr:glutathione S-transferase family protein [Pseudomonadota bacterium]